MHHRDPLSQVGLPRLSHVACAANALATDAWMIQAFHAIGEHSAGAFPPSKMIRYDGCKPERVRHFDNHACFHARKRVTTGKSTTASSIDSHPASGRTKMFGRQTGRA